MPTLQEELLAALKPVIYWRRSMDKDEYEAACRHFTVVTRRTAIRAGSLVIPRYAALPYNEELCEDVAALGAVPINTYHQHCYVANLRNWYYDLAEITPRTWFALDQIPEEGPFVLKGQTNSKKFQWDTHMFAENKRAAMDVFCRLSIDGHVGVQQIYARQYVPLKKLDEGLHGLPISEEYRFFVLDGQILAGGFYWASNADDLVGQYDHNDVPLYFLDAVIARVSPHIRFWVVDVARTAAGEWIVVELNDAQQSGLSCIDPDVFYGALASQLARAAQLGCPGLDIRKLLPGGSWPEEAPSARARKGGG